MFSIGEEEQLFYGGGKGELDRIDERHESEDESRYEQRMKGDNGRNNNHESYGNHKPFANSMES